MAIVGFPQESGPYLARWECDQSKIRLSHTMRIWQQIIRNVASKMSFHWDFAGDQEPFSVWLCSRSNKTKNLQPKRHVLLGVLKQELLRIQSTKLRGTQPPCQGSMVHGKFVVDIHGFIPSFLMLLRHEILRLKPMGFPVWLPGNRYPMVSKPPWGPRTFPSYSNLSVIRWCS